MYGPRAVSEQRLCLRTISLLPEGALVVADRNFGVFAVARALSVCGHPLLLRLTDARAGSLLGEGADLSLDRDVPLTWRPSACERRDHPDLPEGAMVPGRLVVRHVRVGSRREPVRLVLFVSGASQDGDELARLYARRWSVETDLRSLKHALKVSRLSARSPEMLAKELELAVAAFNMVLWLGARAAQRAGVEPRELSFSRLCSCALAYGPRLIAQEDPLERSKLVDELLDRAAARKLKPRNRASPPRHVWERRNRYPSRKPDPE
jgi:hypothetical protein